MTTLPPYDPRYHLVVPKPTWRTWLAVAAVCVGVPLAGCAVVWFVVDAGIDWYKVAATVGVGLLIALAAVGVIAHGVRSMEQVESDNAKVLRAEVRRAHERAFTSQARAMVEKQKADRLEKANAQLGRALDDAITHPCAGCPAAEDVA